MQIIENIKFQRAAENRQKVLDFLKENPGAHSRQIAEALNVAMNTLANWMIEMDRKGEIRREPFILKLPKCAQRSYRCYALVDKTTAWQEMAHKANRVQEEQKAERKPGKNKPWITRNVDPDRKPIQNQGGQGAVRRNGWSRSEEPGWT